MERRLISFPSPAEFEPYRKGLEANAEETTNFALAQRGRFIFKRARVSPTGARQLCKGAHGLCLSGMTDPFSAPFEPRLAGRPASPSTDSGQLGELMEVELLACEHRERHRYLRLAGSAVPRALEATPL